MRLKDWINIQALYLPFWVLLGSGMGLAGRGMNPVREKVWIVASIIVAFMSWRTAAGQVYRERLAAMRDREIQENLGKLVSVTEPSPANILAAAAAKILTLEHSQDQLADQLEQIHAREWPRLSDAQKAELVKRLKQVGPHTIWIVRPNNLDCIALASDFHGVFREAQWDVPHSEPYSIEQQRLGITILGLQDSIQEAVRLAISEITELPARIYEGSERERKSWNEKAVVLSIGPKVI